MFTQMLEEEKKLQEEAKMADGNIEDKLSILSKRFTSRLSISVKAMMDKNKAPSNNATENSNKKN